MSETFRLRIHTLFVLYPNTQPITQMLELVQVRRPDIDLTPLREKYGLKWMVVTDSNCDEVYRISTAIALKPHEKPVMIEHKVKLLQGFMTQNQACCHAGPSTTTANNEE